MTSRLSPADLDALESLHKAATPEGWSVPHFAVPDVNCSCHYVLSDAQMGSIATVDCSDDGDWEQAGDNPKFAEAVANARLIVELRNSFPALLADLREWHRVRALLGKWGEAKLAVADAELKPWFSAPTFMSDTSALLARHDIAERAVHFAVIAIAEQDCNEKAEVKS